MDVDGWREGDGEESALSSSVASTDERWLMDGWMEGCSPMTGHPGLHADWIGLPIGNHI